MQCIRTQDTKGMYFSTFAYHVVLLLFTWTDKKSLESNQQTQSSAQGYFVNKQLKTNTLTFLFDIKNHDFFFFPDLHDYASLYCSCEKRHIFLNILLLLLASNYSFTK